MEKNILHMKMANTHKQKKYKTKEVNKVVLIVYAIKTQNLTLDLMIVRKMFWKLFI